MREICVFFVVFLQLIIASSSQTFPKYIKKCHFGDLKCIKESMNSVIKRFPKGIPDIGMKPIDIVKLKDYQFWNRAVFNNIRLNYKLYNQAMYGFENTTITQVQGFGRNPEDNHLEIHGRIPSLIHKSNFRANGRVYVINMNSTGRSTSDFQNFRFILKLKVIMEYRNNSRYLNVYELSPIVTINRWILQLDDLFKENLDLTLAINKVFNDNWLVFWNTFEQRILDVARRVLIGLIKNIFDKTPYDQMFLKDSTELE